MRRALFPVRRVTWAAEPEHLAGSTTHPLPAAPSPSRRAWMTQEEEGLLPHEGIGIQNERRNKKVLLSLPLCGEDQEKEGGGGGGISLQEAKEGSGHRRASFLPGLGPEAGFRYLGSLLEELLIIKEIVLLGMCRVLSRLHNQFNTHWEGHAFQANLSPNSSRFRNDIALCVSHFGAKLS